MRLVGRAETFERGDLTLHRGDRCHARANRLTVDDDCTAATRAKTAPEFRAVQFQIVAEDVEEWRRWIDVNCVPLAVDPESDRGHRADRNLAGPASRGPAY